MAKKRLIFTLHYSSEFFCLSRNFRLQKVGDLNWLDKNYNFPKIAFSIDELVVLDVSRDGRDTPKFLEILKMLAKEIFVPVAAGGGIRKFEDAKLFFESGADKIVVNEILSEDPDVVRSIAEVYGAQSIVASVDYKINDNGIAEVFIENGTKKKETSLEDHIRYINTLPIGEIYLHSMRQDGTGQGYDIKTYSELAKQFEKPLIISGGAGNRYHLEEGLSLNFVDAVSTANLFNFIGNGLPSAREHLLEKNFNIPKFIQTNL
ncbi:imidazole glycerol phosphate synthase subunit HisF [Leptospira ilyithenensis]|uniref:Imidazole glycerol phosphate synthase subunit HisF n=1 Tax=Leptospira ilyithenensis TaxID=2484901 RepID=A0A4R9LMB5_9LEPT|nr:imidazole glycerol phosphate synthase subunit HisF [Leptospira ilyithenensis]